MTEPAEPPAPAKPVRTWRPMVLWTAGLLLVLGLVWFVAAVAVPVWRTREFVRSRVEGVFMEDPIETLGGPERAARNLSLYLSLPREDQEARTLAVCWLRLCGRHGVKPLLNLLAGTDLNLRRLAADGLGTIGPEASDAIPDLETACANGPWAVRAAAAEALKRIRGEEPGK